MVSSLFGDDDDKDALFATKGWKCISCTKDLKEYEGRLDKFKPWAIFPAKEMSKDKYPGVTYSFISVWRWLPKCRRKSCGKERGRTDIRHLWQNDYTLQPNAIGQHREQ